MVRKSKRQRWKPQELAEFRKFILGKRDDLKLAFYLNLIEGHITHKKSPKFFIEMSQGIRRSANQCKSKFQKMEKKIYLEILGIPPEHYLLYFAQRRVISDLKQIHDYKGKLTQKPKLRSLRRGGTLFQNHEAESSKAGQLREAIEREAGVLSVREKLRKFRYHVIFHLFHKEEGIDFDFIGIFFELLFFYEK